MLCSLTIYIKLYTIGIYVDICLFASFNDYKKKIQIYELSLFLGYNIFSFQKLKTKLYKIIIIKEKKIMKNLILSVL